MVRTIDWDGDGVAILASLLGKPKTIPPGEVERMHRFLHHKYGQRPEKARS